MWIAGAVGMNYHAYRMRYVAQLSSRDAYLLSCLHGWVLLMAIITVTFAYGGWHPALVLIVLTLPPVLTTVRKLAERYRFVRSAEGPGENFKRA